MSDKEVVWLDVGVDDGDAVQQLHQPEQLGHQEHRQRLHDLEIFFRMSKKYLRIINCI